MTKGRKGRHIAYLFLNELPVRNGEFCRQINKLNHMLKENEYNSYFKRYIDPLLEEEEAMVDLMSSSAQQFVELLINLPKDKEEFRYEVGKWTIKEMLLHIIDTERIFQYRALRFARKDTIELPGFDQDVFNESAEANSRSLQSLVDEFVAVRQASVTLFDGFSEEALLRIGVASESPISVRALGYLVSGHQIHHQKVFVERYL